jgi:ABC-type transport system involved in cytochrome c biogenesis permease subunit
MATNTLPEVMDFASDEPKSSAVGQTLRSLLAPLASLKITVVSFALAIFLILAGTLAQIDHDIWQVMGEYFRTPLAWIPFQIFVPRSIHLSGGFWFPGGFTIGSVMLVNLLAAHALRFKLQARGSRMLGGLALVTVGVLMTWLVVVSGSNKEGIEGQPLLSYSTLWQLCKWGVIAAWLANMGVLVSSLSPGATASPAKRWLTMRGAVVLGLLSGLLFYLGDDAELSGPSMRILWQLMKGGFAGLVLLAGCVMLFRKRAGVVLLHFGIGMMMINELWVYMLHSEAQMQIREGETVNYVQDIRSLELAVVDSSNPKHDEVVVIPRAVLLNEREMYLRDSLAHLGKFGDWLASVFLREPSGVIRDSQLPFDIEVVKFLQSSTPRQVNKDEENLADAGQGLSFVVDEAQPSTGTDMSSGVDMSAAYAKFIDKQSGKSLGTHLLSLYPMFGNERVTVDGKSYNVALRFKRKYMPYAVHLIDVRFDKYIGTSTAKNYSSDVRLIDPSRHEDRTVKIWMNNPLRYAGETFYQSNYNVDPMSRKEMTGLQVVTNTGWMIPYVGCMIVATGLLAHFGVVLVRFLQRQNESAAAVDRGVSKRQRRLQEPADRRPLGRWSAVVFAAVSAAWLLTSPGSDLSLGRFWTTSNASDKMQLADFGRLPVVYEGRMKPFDTLARNSLQILSNRDYFIDLDGKKQPAVKWLLDLLVSAPDLKKYQVVKVDSPELQQTLALPKDREHFRYSIEELLPNYDEFVKQVKLADEVDEKARDDFQRKIIELHRRLRLFGVLQSAFEPPHLSPKSSEREFFEALQRQKEMMDDGHMPLAIPPNRDGGEWQTYAFAISIALAKVHVMGEEADQPVVDFSSVLSAYTKGDAAGFNRALEKYSSLLRDSRPPEYDPSKVAYEQFFDRLNPFLRCETLYITAFLLAVGGWLGWRAPLHRAAFWLLVLTLVLHTRALEGRIFISGRPPVTNLYSAAVFIGWGAVILGLVLERFSRLGIGNVIAAVAGFVSLLVAGWILDRNVLKMDPDTFTVLQAVLDTQFWLATHVVCITLGYATTFVAGLLGLLYVLGGLFTPALSPNVRREVTRMTYGVLCFAIFFSFVGTVLGGLWADDSWGRFWGWDPKENGALIIVLWNALVLHARWDGMVKDRGLAVLAIVGNIAVAWSMFGVNELNAGLHSYGFTEGVTLWLTIFVASQLLAVAVGTFVPKRLWRSYQPELA